MNIKIGSRKSTLALMQTELVAAKLKRKFPEDDFEIVPMLTKGDKDQNTSLRAFGGKGVFIEEIENSLLDGTIDIAVHSAKDMPVELAEGLIISAAAERADRRDVLVYYDGTDIFAGEIIVGTSSARRELQAAKYFPDAVFKPIRGNIQTRLDKVRRGEFDAVIMAKAAIDRLGITDVKIYEFDGDFLCAAGQGILAVETVKGHLKRYTDAVNDEAAMAELIAERAFLECMGGGCHSPCGASARYADGRVTINAFYADDGKEIRVRQSSVSAYEAGKSAAEEIKKWYI